MKHFFFSNRVDLLDAVIESMAAHAHRQQHTIDVACEVVETTVRGRTTRSGLPTTEPDQTTTHHHALPVPDHSR